MMTDKVDIMNGVFVKQILAFVGKNILPAIIVGTLILIVFATSAYGVVKIIKLNNPVVNFPPTSQVPILIPTPTPLPTVTLVPISVPVVPQQNFPVQEQEAAESKSAANSEIEDNDLEDIHEDRDKENQVDQDDQDDQDD